MVMFSQKMNCERVITIVFKRDDLVYGKEIKFIFYGLTVEFGLNFDCIQELIV